MSLEKISEAEPKRIQATIFDKELGSVRNIDTDAVVVVYPVSNGDETSIEAVIQGEATVIEQVAMLMAIKERLIPELTKQARENLFDSGLSEELFKALLEEL
jgi:hypothetical protein